MPTVSFASSKGGAGKTTSAIVLGTTLARHARVAFIDADPEANLAAWHEIQPVPNTILIRSEGERAIQDEIEQARASARVVIIDLEGVASRANAYAMIESDLILVPCMEGQQEVNKAIATINLIEREGRALRRPLPHAVFHADTPPARNFKTRLGRMLNESMRGATRVMDTELHHWASIAALHNEGGGLAELSRSEYRTLDRAIENAEAFASETFDLIEEARNAEAV